MVYRPPWQKIVRTPMFANVCVWNYNFYGRGCCDSRDDADPHRLPMPVSDPRHDTDTTEPSAPR